MQTASAHEQVPSGRQRLLWEALVGALSATPERDGLPEVLDCGGGSGTDAVPLAKRGALVTVVDISVDALATLTRRAEEAGVADRVLPVQGDVEALADAAPGDRFDLVLAHGVLESVDDAPAALQAMAAAVRPGGTLSVLVANPDAAVLARALSGDLAAALAALRSPRSGGLRPAEVSELCVQSGLQVQLTQGLGVFTELVPGSEVDGHPDAVETLAELERLAAGRSPYRDIASRVHILARRPMPDAPGIPLDGVVAHGT